MMRPYTLGSEMGTPGSAPAGGAAFYLRRKRFMAYIMASIALLLVMG